MGFSFTIGNAIPVHSKENGCLEAWWDVEAVELNDAPIFPNDGMREKSNNRAPSYTAWGDFCREAGGDVYRMFYGDGPRERGGILEGHPGCVLLTQEHLDIIRAALARRRKASTKEPGFAGDPIREAGKVVGYVDGDRYDSTLARLIWLEFWVSWALANCETPAIQHS